MSLTTALTSSGSVRTSCFLMNLRRFSMTRPARNACSSILRHTSISVVIPGCSRSKNPPRGLSVGGDRAQRLIDLVRDTRRHLAHQVEAADVREARLDRPSAKLRGSLRGQIADDPDEAPAVRVARLADRERDRKGLAVRAPAEHFAPDADDSRLAGREIALDVPVVLRVVRLGHQEIHRLAEDFGRGVPEQPFGRRVERRNSAAVVDHDDRVDGRVEKGL